MSSDKPSLDALRIDRSAASRRKKSSWPLIIFIFILLALAAGGWAFLKPKATLVEVATVMEEVSNQVSGNAPAATLLNASGYVTARRQATVSSKVTGKVLVVMVEEGMKVKEGQILAHLDSSNVDANLHLAEAQLEAAKRTMEETVPNLDFARQEAKRFAGLAASKATSESDYRRAETQAKALEATLARQKAQIVVAEKEVAQWKQQVDDNIIRAPFEGIVTSKNAQPGEMISPISAGGGYTRTGICTIVDMESLEIDVDVSESYINRVQPGAPVEAILDSYPEARFPAKVIAIIPTADRQKATVKVRVGFDKLDPRILPDMGVKVAFKQAQAEQTAVAEKSDKKTRSMIIPSGALSSRDGKDIVWVVNQGRVESRDVIVTQTVGGQSTIASGLTTGESVVVNAPSTLSNGSRVSEKKS